MSIVCYFARGYFARLIFTTSAPQIALIFGFLAGAIFFRTIYAIVSRWFYAQKDTVTPLLVSIFAIALNLYLAIRTLTSNSIRDCRLGDGTINCGRCRSSPTVLYYALP